MSPDFQRPALDTVESKRQAREQIEADVEAFKANGGQIQNLTPQDMSPSRFRYTIHPSNRITFGDDADADDADTDTNEE